MNIELTVRKKTETCGVWIDISPPPELEALGVQPYTMLVASFTAEQAALEYAQDLESRLSSTLADNVSWRAA